MYKISKILGLCLTLSALLFSSPSFARQWDCHATISVQGATNLSHTIRQFSMRDNNIGTARRHIKCQAEIKRRFIDSGSIWRLLHVPANTQNSYCGNSKRLRVNYGLAQRNKSFNFTANSTPTCSCTSSCPNGYTTRGSNCERRLCATSLSNRSHLRSGVGLVVRNGAIFESKRPSSRSCRFR